MYQGPIIVDNKDREEEEKWFLRKLPVTCKKIIDLILYVHSTIFQLCGKVLPGFNQY